MLKSLIIALLAAHPFFMTTDTNILEASGYRYLYNFLLVLTDDQISKLRNIAIGTNNLSDFSEREIRDLEVKLDQKTVHGY